MSPSVQAGTTPRQRRKITPLTDDTKPVDVAEAKTEATAVKQPDWGRTSKVDWLNVLLCVLLYSAVPFLVVLFWSTCSFSNGSLRSSLSNLSISLPKPSLRGFQIYFGWVLLQGLLYAFVPGKVGYGQRTPAGLQLPYKINGLKVWAISHLLFYYAAFQFSWLSPTIIHDNWEGILVAANVYGYALAAFSYLKAHYFPSHPEDRKFSGSRVYDFIMGIEFNPRLGQLWDFKLFHNGRPGIIGWTLINFSFAAAQYKSYGYVSNSMFLVNVLQALYVLDFFVYEDWYLRTIDIAHDHFGLMLAWGDSVWLPFMYTLQAQYLVKNPVALTNLQLYGYLALGLTGYLIFRSANNQKDRMRRNNGQMTVWGRPATYIKASFKSSDGTQHQSLLLTSGFWGISRHFNYLGDLMLSLSMCLACGFKAALPYFYIAYMSILLLHRINRDQARCQGKYGKYWDEYCKQVPYKLIPYVY